MGIIIRQSVKSTVVTYVGVGLGIINIVILATKYFSPVQIGLSRVIFENALLFSSFAQLGAPYIAIKYFNYFKNREKKNSGFLFFLLTYGLTGFLFFLILYFFSKDLFVHYYDANAPELIDYYYYLIPIVLFTIYLNILEAFCQVNERIVIPTMVREIVLKLSNSILILLFALDVLSFDGYLIGMIAITGCAPVLLAFYLKQLKKFDFRKDFSWLNRTLLKEMVVFGLFIVLGGIGNMLATKIDVLMLPAMTSLQSTGIYVIAIFIAAVIEIPKRSIGQISTPILAEAIRKDDRPLISSLYRKTSLNQLIVGSFLFLLVWCNIDSIFLIMPNTAVYQQGKNVVFFIAFARLIDMASGINTEIILNSKYFRFGLTSIAVLALLTITSNLIFIPLYGINGAACAAALSIFIYTFIKVYYVWKKFSIQPYTMKTFYVITCTLVTYCILILIPGRPDDFTTGILYLMIKSFLIAIVYIGIILKFKISEDVSHLATVIFRKLKR